MGDGAAVGTQFENLSGGGEEDQGQFQGQQTFQVLYRGSDAPPLSPAPPASAQMPTCWWWMDVISRYKSEANDGGRNKC